MIDFNNRILRSARLTYRLLEDGDRAALRAILSSPAVTEPAGFRMPATEAEFDEFFIVLTAYDTGVAILSGDVLVGYIHVYPENMAGTVCEGSRCVGFGFVIGEAFQWRGYATEALIAMTEYMRDARVLLPDASGLPVRGPVDYCLADHFEGNEASRRVIEKAGYRYLETYTYYFEELGREMTCLSYVFDLKEN